MEKLTAQEEAAMQIIWSHAQEITVRDVLEKLSDDIPYTTLASTIKNLEKKGFIRSRKIGNVSVYKSDISQDQYKKSFLSGFVKEYFDNSYKQMVNFFVEEEKLSQKELKEIISIIEKGKK